MAKVINPDEKLQNYQTVGSSITLRKRGDDYFISRRVSQQVRSANSEIFIEENSEAIQKEWEGLSPVEKSEWEEQGLEVVQTGYETFYNQSIKGLTSSRCGIAICLLNRCVGV